MIKGAIVGLVIVTLSGSTSIPERETFDVAVGDVSILHSGKLMSYTYINCIFTVDDFSFAPDQPAFVAVEFTSTVPNNYDSDANLARVAAYRSEKSQGWLHLFTLTDPKDNTSKIIAYKGETDSVLRMSLAAGWGTGEVQATVFIQLVTWVYRLWMPRGIR